MSDVDQHKLKLRRIGIDTDHENVACMHRDCPVYRAEGFQALAKIEVLCNSRDILAVLNAVDAACPSNFDFARQLAALGSGYAIGTAEDLPRVFAEF